MKGYIFVKKPRSMKNDLLPMRNRLLVARYYYWTDLCRRRFDDVLNILSEQEFFVSDRTITNTLSTYDSFYQKLYNKQFQPAQLRKLWPSWNWDVHKPAVVEQKQLFNKYELL